MEGSGGASLRSGRSVIEHVERWAALIPEEPALDFIDIDGESQDRRTYGDLAQRAAAIAAVLQERMGPGSPVVLLYPPGLPFIDAFMGCMKAGMIPIPAYPPDPMRLAPTVDRLVAMIRDARPSAVLVDAFIASHADLLFEMAPALRETPWIVTEDLPPAHEGQQVAVARSEVAFVQYSSGSTGDPQGVVLTHANLEANLRMIETTFAPQKARDVGLSWLPTYHDMGLIGAVLMPLILGAGTLLMSPVDFLRRPWAWLQAMSRYHCTISGGPSFAYELCVRKTPAEVDETLDLSAWRIAFNGAEPIDVGALRSFTERFGRAGFAPEAMLPCYGLAEATLLVTAKPCDEGPTIVTVDADALAGGRIAPPGARTRDLVSCGPPAPGVELRIVDPSTATPVAPGVVGEIEVGGPSIASRYWGDRGPSSTFRSVDGVPWVRTGDLGALVDGQLIPTGRVKDVLMVRGRNIYPQDLERAAEAADPAVRSGCSVAFSIDPGTDERIVVAVEVKAPSEELPAIADRVRIAIAAEGVSVAAVVLAPPHGLPKTSSGKVRRAAVRTRWRAGELDVLLERGTGGPLGPGDGAREPWDEAALVARFREEVASILGGTPDAVPVDTPFAELGLDSAALIELQTRLEAAIGAAVPDDALWGRPTIAGVAGALTRADAVASAAGNGAAAAETVASVGAAAPGPVGPAGPEPVSIIGVGVRIGSVEGPEAWWEAFSKGDPDQLLAPRPGSAGGVTHGRFDAAFFGISAREARRMEPGHRTLLEVTWQAVEDAGIDPRRLAGQRVGVFVGAAPSEYAVLSDRSGAEPSVHSVTGLAGAMAANRISYVLDLRGPSITVDTACSSSLVAVHLAVQSLRAGECDLALVGGVNAVLTDDIADALASVGAMSPTGRCHAFDAAADGYVRAEGCGVVLLEQAGAARSAGRRSYAEILGSAVNQDGRSNGITAPNPVAQREVVGAALADARCGPNDVVAVEAHGTGTPLGDPIECGALRTVLGARRRPVLLTSVKAVVGHQEAAAGIISLVRTSLCAARGLVPRQAGFDSLNALIDLGGALVVPAEDTPWTDGVCGVSSFGFGGTNAHVVMARVPAAPGWPLVDPCVLPVSAPTPEILRERIGQVVDLLRTGSPRSVRRRLMPLAGQHRHRAVLRGVADEVQDQLERLTAADGPEASERRDRLVVVFGGQGAGSVSAWHRDLRDHPVVGGRLREIDGGVGPVAGRRLLDWLDAPGPLPTAVAQPLFTAVSLALYRALEQTGVVTDVVLGHSLGEVAALAAAGAFDDVTAVTFAVRRGEAMQEHMPQGAMATLLAGADDVAELIARTGSRVVIAACNGPSSTVVAGDPDDVTSLCRDSEHAGIRSLVLEVDRAFHSPHVDRSSAALAAASPALVQETHTAVVTTADGVLRPPGWVPEPGHWVAHARLPVLFDRSIASAVDGAASLLLEIGPTPALGRLRRRCAGERWCALVAEERDAPLIIETAAELFLAGWDVPWDSLVRGPVPDIAVPPRPFRRTTYWISEEVPAVRGRPTGPDPAPAPAIPAVRPVERVAPPTVPAGVHGRDGLATVLAGFGVGPGSRVALHRLPATAGVRVEDALGQLGVGIVELADGGATDADLVVAGPGAGPPPGDLGWISVDAKGCPTGSLDPIGSSTGRPLISLAFFGDHARGTERQLYRDLLDLARLADECGLSAVWTPERHFDSFGGPFPSPAVLSAAIARETRRIGIRAGSVVLPLAHPARIVEDWCLVDNLSDGRVGMALATGWRDRDRVLAPTADPPDVEGAIDLVRRLWSGEEVALVGVDDHEEVARVRPPPVQPTPPLWLTVMKNPDSWRRAARLGLNVLTNLLGRPIASLGQAVDGYQSERRALGHGPGEVTVMVHAHLSPDAERARAEARGPLERYLAASATVFSQAASLPWLQDRMSTMSRAEVDAEIEALTSAAADRYLDGSSLIGDPESCGAVLDHLGSLGVTEVACLVDFGLDRQSMLRTVGMLGDLAASASGTRLAAPGPWGSSTRTVPARSA